MREIYTAMRENPEYEYPVSIHIDSTNTVIGMSYGEESRIGDFGYKKEQEMGKEGVKDNRYIPVEILQSIHTQILGILCFDTYKYSECMVVENGIGIDKKFCKNPDNIKAWDIVQVELQNHVNHILKLAA